MSYPLIIRQKAIEQYQENIFTQEEVASNFGVHLSTFKRWLVRDHLGKGLSPIVGNAGRPGKIDEEGLDTIEKIVQEKPSITLEELSSAYEEIHNVNVGRSILSRALKKLNFRRKKLSFQASEKNALKVKKKKIVSEFGKR
jgi:transposase